MSKADFAKMVTIILKLHLNYDGVPLAYCIRKGNKVGTPKEKGQKRNQARMVKETGKCTIIV